MEMQCYIRSVFLDYVALHYIAKGIKRKNYIDLLTQKIWLETVPNHAPNFFYILSILVYSWEIAKVSLLFILLLLSLLCLFIPET